MAILARRSKQEAHVPAIEDREECRSQTKRDLEGLICQLLGGRGAKWLYYGDGQGDSKGFPLAYKVLAGNTASSQDT